jgi:hypothetical protein
MLQKKCLYFFFLLSLFFSTSIAADTNERVAAWTQQTLLATFSVGDNADRTQIRKNYTDNAWQAMNQFFAPYIQVIKDKQLILHPVANGPAVVVKSGTITSSNFFKGLQFWQVNQSITVPELNAVINFSVGVIEAPTESKYIIQSLNVSLQKS